MCAPLLGVRRFEPLRYLYPEASSIETDSADEADQGSRILSVMRRSIRICTKYGPGSSLPTLLPYVTMRSALLGGRDADIARATRNFSRRQAGKSRRGCGGSSALVAWTVVVLLFLLFVILRFEVWGALCESADLFEAVLSGFCDRVGVVAF